MLLEMRLCLKPFLQNIFQVVFVKYRESKRHKAKWRLVLKESQNTLHLPNMNYIR